MRIQSQQEEIQNLVNRDNEKDEDEDNEDDGSSETSSDDIFEETVDQLPSYSFISFGKNETSFEIHELVQLMTQMWFIMHEKDEK